MAQPDRRAPRDGAYGDNERYEGPGRDERHPDEHPEPRSYRQWLARRGYVDERGRGDPSRGYGGRSRAGPGRRGYDDDLAGRSFDAQRPVVDFEDPWIPPGNEGGPYYPDDELELHPGEADPYADEPDPRRSRYYAERGPWAEQARQGRGREQRYRQASGYERYRGERDYGGEQRYRSDQGYRPESYGGERYGRDEGYRRDQGYRGEERYGRDEAHGAGERYGERHGGERYRSEGYADQRYADERHPPDRVYGQDLERAGSRGRPEPGGQYHGEREYGGERSYGGVRDYSHDRDYGRPRGMQHGYQQYGNDLQHSGGPRQYPGDRRFEGESPRRERGDAGPRERYPGEREGERERGDDDRGRGQGGYGRDSGPPRGGSRR